MTVPALVNQTLTPICAPPKLITNDHRHEEARVQQIFIEKCLQKSNNKPQVHHPRRKLTRRAMPNSIPIANKTNCAKKILLHIHTDLRLEERAFYSTPYTSTTCTDARFKYQRKTNRPRCRSRSPRSRRKRRSRANHGKHLPRRRRRNCARKRKPRTRSGARRKRPSSSPCRFRRCRLESTRRPCCVRSSRRATVIKGISASSVMIRMWDGRWKSGICTRMLGKTSSKVRFAGYHPLVQRSPLTICVCQ
jgi:hypothetical protein